MLSRYYKAVEAVLAACIHQLDHREETARHFPDNDRIRFRFLAQTYARQVRQTLSSRFLAPAYVDLARKLHTRNNWNPRVRAAQTEGVRTSALRNRYAKKRQSRIEEAKRGESGATIVGDQVCPPPGSA